MKRVTIGATPGTAARPPSDQVVAASLDHSFGRNTIATGRYWGSSVRRWVQLTGG